MLKDRIVPGLSANSNPEHIAELLLRIMPDVGMCLVSHKDLANNINLNVMGKRILQRWKFQQMISLRKV